MVQIPDSARPYVEGFVRYHFWILAVVVPLLLLPMVFAANGGLRQQINTQKASIDSHVSALENIQREADHPNNTWVEAVDRRTADVRKEILAQWEAFWASQQPLRVWPPELGADFLATIQSLEDGQQDRLPANLLQRYQNTVPDFVRMLPARMGCTELMSDAGEDSAPGGTAGAPSDSPDDTESPEASLTHVPLVWQSDDQARLYTSFLWQREPSTAQVRLAQEELWVYGLFCDTIKSINAGATGAFNATITTVQELAVGHPAAEESPGGRGGGRILWKVDLASLTTPVEGEGEEVPTGPAATVTVGPLNRPGHPRFDSSASSVSEDAGPTKPSPTEAGLGEAPPSPDDPFHEWIYVDFDGRPLSAAALKTAREATMVHLMPFTLRVVMDQRKIDRLIQALASNTIPIDVRQVRINPGRDGASLGSGGGFDEGSSGDFGSRPRRPYDVSVELRGTVGLATPPNEAAMGGEDGGEDSVGDPS